MKIAELNKLKGTKKHDGPRRPQKRKTPRRSIPLDYAYTNRLRDVCKALKCKQSDFLRAVLNDAFTAADKVINASGSNP